MLDAAVIETKGFGKSYGAGQPVLTGLDIEIRHRERVALIGSNGSGKSTLLKCLVGLTSSTEGSVQVLGETFHRSLSGKQKRRVRRQIGFVFQHHGLVRQLSALTNVIHGMLGFPGSWRASLQISAPNAWREAAIEALAAVGLEEKALERVDALSGGQQQRVAIARALVRRPRLIIADEPAASLDPAAGRDVMDLFSDLAREQGITLLYTTHDMEHAVAFSDRVIALKNGGVHYTRPSGSVSESMLGEVFDGA